MEKLKRARRRKPETSQGGPEAIRLQCSGGQGVCRETESEGHAENYRAVVDGGDPETNRSAEGGARSSSLYGGEGVTHPPTRFKVIADGTVGKNNT